MKLYTFLEDPCCTPTYGELHENFDPALLDTDEYLTLRIVGGTDYESAAVARYLRYEMYMMDEPTLAMLIDNHSFVNANTVRMMYRLVQIDKQRQEEEFRKAIEPYL